MPTSEAAKPVPNATSPIAFDEFKLFYDSAERVTDRRLELNRTNSSLMILIVAGIGAAAAWAQDKPSVLPYALALIIVTCLLSILFCRWWWKQLEAYKDLNGAKFAVLNDMAKHVVFPGYDLDSVRSAEPFEREWEILSRQKALQKYKGGLALGSSLSELTIPKSFLTFFVLCLTAAVAVAIVRLSV
jgi:disulfide bond formation protein DsbB